MIDSVLSIKDVLLTAGCHVWSKKGHRIYISKVWDILLRVTCIRQYQTNKISFFRIDETEMDLDEANKLIEILNHAYYDVDAEKWVGMDNYEYLWNDLETIMKRAESMFKPCRPHHALHLNLH